MEQLARSLLEELNVETAFTIPLFGGIPIAESVFVTWIVMAILILAAFLTMFQFQIVLLFPSFIVYP